MPLLTIVYSRSFILKITKNYITMWVSFYKQKSTCEDASLSLV